MLQTLAEAFYLSWPLWAFLSILGASLFVEEGIRAHSKRKAIDNPTLW